MMGVRKLKDSRGETLVELLASILIASLSVAVLFTCCMASVEMDKETRSADQAYYEHLSAAEGRTGPAEGAKVNVAGNGAELEVDVVLHGGGEMYSYQWEEVPPVDP